MCVEVQGGWDDLRSILCGSRPKTRKRALALLRQLQQFEPNLGNARVDQANLTGDTVGYINFAALLIGTTVIDANNFKLSGSGVDDANDGPERENGVSRGEGLGVEALAISGLLTVELRTIPAGIAYPSLDRLGGVATMGHERGFHRRCDEEHKGNPSESSPDNKEWSSHSVFFMLQTSKKV